MKRLNVGCGLHFHPAWTNLDIEATTKDVIEHDVRGGLPFENGAFDAVYHSHVLEHLPLEDGRRLLGECRRVLAPGGVLRVVVPDLEGIARGYLHTLDAAADDEDRWADHRWMTVELLDQLVRGEAGGQMAELIQDRNLPNESFIRSRIGAIFGNVSQPGVRSRSHRPWGRRLAKELRRWQHRVAAAALGLLAGREGQRAYREGVFRRSGEIHRWMYDRVSLARLLREVGLDETRVCGPEESRIPDFASYQLDAVEGSPRKPDSLYMEATLPATAARAA